MSKPVVAIVGKQNVGKSTLLNRVAGRPVAIVEDLPGTTRDRIFFDVSWRDTKFTLIDTGGLGQEQTTTIESGVKEQVIEAVAEADVVVFIVDVKSGVGPADLEISDILRRSGKPVILAANKADNDRLEAQAVEFFELGMGEPIPLSAYHGRNMTDLMDKVVSMLPEPADETGKAEVMRLSIIGKPNVGKSMLLNAITGEKRSIVSEIAGTTRDALDTMFDFGGENVLLIDTAGIRRSGHIIPGVERYSVIRAVRAIERSDIALLVLDATEGVTAQDAHVGAHIQQMAKGVVIILNKWDLVTDKKAHAQEWENLIRSELKFLDFAPILYTSAKTGKGTDSIIPVARQVYRERNRRLSTSEVNHVVQQAIATQNLPRLGKKQLKVLYATQSGVNPPTFVFSINDVRLIHFSYERFLENKLREAFGFFGTPIRLIFRGRTEKG